MKKARIGAHRVIGLTVYPPEPSVTLGCMLHFQFCSITKQRIANFRDILPNSREWGITICSNARDGDAHPIEHCAVSSGIERCTFMCWVIFVHTFFTQVYSILSNGWQSPLLSYEPTTIPTGGGSPPNCLCCSKSWVGALACQPTPIMTGAAFGVSPPLDMTNTIHGIGNQPIANPRLNVTSPRGVIVAVLNTSTAIGNTIWLINKPSSNNRCCTIASMVPLPNITTHSPPFIETITVMPAVVAWWLSGYGFHAKSSK